MCYASLHFERKLMTKPEVMNITISWSRDLHFPFVFPFNDYLFSQGQGGIVNWYSSKRCSVCLSELDFILRWNLRIISTTSFLFLASPFSCRSTIYTFQDLFSATVLAFEYKTENGYSNAKKAKTKNYPAVNWNSF